MPNQNCDTLRALTSQFRNPINPTKDCYLESPASNFYGAAAVRQVDGVPMFAVIDEAQETQWHHVSKDFFMAFVTEFGTIEVQPDDSDSAEELERAGVEA